jgi:hypothetical protein
LKPKIAEMKKLSEAVKAKRAAKLPADAKKFLDNLTRTCTDFPTTIENKRKAELDNWKKLHNV